MNEPILIAIISAGLSALITCLFQLVNKLIDNRQESRQKKNSELASYKEKKEKVYIAAIGRLLQIRRGFDFTREKAFLNDELKEEMHKCNVEYMEIASQLRLYASDLIFTEYYRLAMYSRFAYAPQNGPRLIETSKWAYDTEIVILARLMQEDLGYRKLTSEYQPFICPKCNKEHDIYSKCPSCGMTYSELKKVLQESLNQVPDSSDSEEELSTE